MKHTWMVTASLVVLFFVAQVVGLVVTGQYVDVPASDVAGETVWKELPSVGGVQIERPDVEPELSIWYILVAVIIGTILILFIIRLGKTFLWRAWFFVAIAMCLYIAFGAFLPAVLSLILALVAGWLKVFRPNVFIHNITELFIYGGLAVIFVPILTVFYAFMLLLALSAYDAYAVWRSKHMITMAKFQTESGIFAGLLLPYARQAKVSKKAKKKKRGKSKVRTAVLGGGDIGFPLIFSGTVLVAQGFLPAIIVSVGATLALLVLLLSSKKDRFYPAMPFLTVGCALGFAVLSLL